MKIDLTSSNPTIDAADLAKALDLEPADVAALMRAGAITSRLETGVDEDAGSHRLTFWHGDIKVRFTCAADGTVVKTSRIKSKRKP
tara:strand:- start:1734 stop:1991 length:258 start_codon:yes stop_codon:yes gene_type:complete